MGYYSNFSFEIMEKTKVDPRAAKELERFFSDEKNPDIYGFQGVKLILNENDELEDITFKDEEGYYGKFYDDALFSEKLSRCLLTGAVLLKFIGEDYSIWGYHVSPEGVKALITVMVPDDKETITVILKKVKIVIFQ